MSVTRIASEKVKMVDIHPKEPLFITACYTGVVNLYNYNTSALIKSFDTGKGTPTRCARFIPQLQSFVCGSDDKHLRVFNYHTMERTQHFRAHDDYIRSIAVHDQLPVVLSCADSGTICHWDWSENWVLKCVYEAHSNYCMDVAFNPTNASSFASASMDCSICVWTLNNPEPNYELLGHEEGVLCLQYYPRGDKPYLLSGSDDLTARLWDYQTKACLYVFSDSSTVTSVTFSPDMPLLFVLTQSGFLNKISLETFMILDTVCQPPGVCGLGGSFYGWSLATKPKTNILIAGYDTGVTIYKLGDSKPVFSMDSNGKVVVSEGNELQRMDIKNAPATLGDGDSVPVNIKELGAIESRPDSLVHNGNGQFIAAMTQWDYTIISSLTLRQKAYGKGVSFVWGQDNSSYAVLETSTTVVVYQAFKKRGTINLYEAAEKLFPGTLLVVRGSTATFFYDWESLVLVRQIDEKAERVQWCPTGELVALATASEIYVLKYNQETAQEYLQEMASSGSEGGGGADSAFDLAEEIEDVGEDLLWVGDCLVFSTPSHRLNYFIGGETNTLAILHPNEFILGYLPKTNRIFCMDRDKNITSYALQYNVISYMAAIVREDFDEAATLLDSIPESSRYKVAQFLQARGLLDLALDVTTEDQHRFSLAIELKKLDLAQQLVRGAESVQKWQQLANLALQEGDIPLALEGFEKSADFNAALLILSSLRDISGIARLGENALAAGKAHTAFTCFHLSQRHDDAVKLLLRVGKAAEAAFYARTYCSELIESAVSQWKQSESVTPRIRDAIANPVSYPNLFSLQRPQGETFADTDMGTPEPLENE